MKLFISAFTKTVFGLLLIGAMLFLPAGGFNYPHGWLFLALLFIPMIPMGIVMLIKAPALLQKRLDAKEKLGGQRSIIALSGLVFLSAFIISALDHRFSWSSVPLWLVITASVLFLLGYGGYMEVMRENEYLSRTVKVEGGQRVIDTGLYGIVRHPMYLATLLMFLPIPLILGSFIGLIPISFYIPLIVARIIGEEKLLSAELSGYNEYKKKVKYRLIPFIW
jgi:protein-S-isoprenylcysteine O-methyltransferase Ste14